MNTSLPLIVHLPRWYPNKNDDLNGIFIQRHIKTTVSYSTPVVLQATYIAKQQSIFSWHYEFKDDIHQYTAYYKKNITGLAFIDRFLKLAFYFFAMEKLWRKMKRDFNQPVKGIHLHVLLRNGIVALTKPSIPFIVTEHSSAYQPHKNTIKGFRKWLTRHVIKKSKHVTTVSRQLCNTMQDHHQFRGAEYSILPNVVDTSTFFYNSHHSIGHPPPLKLLHVSEFNEADKNITGILNTAKRCKEHGIPATFTITGYGHYEKQLKAFSENHKLEDIVHFTGKKTGNALVSLFQQHHVFLLFSRQENFPCVLLEAMSCGRPIIATRVGGIPEMIDQTSGILVPSEDEEALYQAILSMIKNYTSYNAQQIAKAVSLKYSYSAISSQLYDLYKRYFSL